MLEGAIPLAAVNEGIRSALGSLFTWKLAVLIAIIFLSILFYRPFCKWLCPLGAFYALMNKVSLFGIKVDEHKCVSCGKCAGACKMDVDITKNARPRRMYTLRQVHQCLSDGGGKLSIRFQFAENTLKRQ